MENTAPRTQQLLATAHAASVPRAVLLTLLAASLLGLTGCQPEQESSRPESATAKAPRSQRAQVTAKRGAKPKAPPWIEGCQEQSAEGSLQLRDEALWFQPEHIASSGKRKDDEPILYRLNANWPTQSVLLPRLDARGVLAIIAPETKKQPGYWLLRKTNKGRHLLEALDLKTFAREVLLRFPAGQHVAYFGQLNDALLFRITHKNEQWFEALDPNNLSAPRRSAKIKPLNLSPRTRYQFGYGGDPDSPGGQLAPINTKSAHVLCGDPSTICTLRITKKALTLETSTIEALWLEYQKGKPTIARLGRQNPLQRHIKAPSTRCLALPDSPDKAKIKAAKPAPCAKIRWSKGRVLPDGFLCGGLFCEELPTRSFGGCRVQTRMALQPEGQEGGEIGLSPSLSGDLKSLRVQGALLEVSLIFQGAREGDTKIALDPRHFKVRKRGGAFQLRPNPMLSADFETGSSCWLGHITARAWDLREPWVHSAVATMAHYFERGKCE